MELFPGNIPTHNHTQQSNESEMHKHTPCRQRAHSAHRGSSAERKQASPVRWSCTLLEIAVMFACCIGVRTVTAV